MYKVTTWLDALAGEALKNDEAGTLGDVVVWTHLKLG